MDAQLNLRHNVEDMHKALHDLEAWTSEIGSRDKVLRGHDPPECKDGHDDDDDDEEAEIAEAKAELARLEATPVPVGTKSASSAVDPDTAPGSDRHHTRTHTEKYSAWENYDAGGAIKQLEARESAEADLRSKLTRLENGKARAAERRRQERDAAAAEVLKLNGNAAYAAARYEDAVGAYTEALELNPRAAVLYANRALALLKLAAPEEAEEDCTAALALEPAHVKALLRRAQARQQLSKYDCALEDLERALQVEPKNGAARRQLVECRQLRARAVPRRAPPSCKLEIVEVDHDEDNDDDPFVLAVGTELGADRPTADSVASETASAGTNTASIGAVYTPELRPLCSVKRGAEAFGAPKNAADIERAWRSMRRQPEDFGRYVHTIDPDRLRTIFKHSLPAELLSAFLLVIDTHILPDSAQHAVGVLEALSCAGRFQILTMCLDTAEERAIASIFAQLHKACDRGALVDVGPEQLRGLAAKYNA